VALRHGEAGSGRGVVEGVDRGRSARATRGPGGCRTAASAVARTDSVCRRSPGPRPAVRVGYETWAYLNDLAESNRALGDYVSARQLSMPSSVRRARSSFIVRAAARCGSRRRRALGSSS
jgi:hypothetical protein